MKSSLIKKAKTHIRSFLFPPLWKGNYHSWAEAEQNSIGYDDGLILEKVKKAVITVKNGGAAFERDSVLFDKAEYSWPLLSILMWIANKQKGELNIIDFGGSLGSSYYQNRYFFSDLKSIQWNIIEQPNFVECGKELFEDKILKFHHTIDDSIRASGKNPDIVLLLSVLQYLKEPYRMLQEMTDKKAPYIFIERTGFVMQDNDRLTVQTVPESIYKASYPCWFFSYSNFLITMDKSGYELISDFYGPEGIISDFHFKGLLFKLK